MPQPPYGVRGFDADLRPFRVLLGADAFCSLRSSVDVCQRHSAPATLLMGGRFSRIARTLLNILPLATSVNLCSIGNGNDGIWEIGRLSTHLNQCIDYFPAGMSCIGMCLIQVSSSRLENVQESLDSQHLASPQPVGHDLGIGFVSE